MFEIRDKYDFRKYSTVDNRNGAEIELHGNPEFIAVNTDNNNLFHWNHENEEIEETSLNEVIRSVDQALRHHVYLDYAVNNPDQIGNMNRFITDRYIYSTYGIDQDTVEIKNGAKYFQAPNHFKHDIFDEIEQHIKEDTELTDIRLKHNGTTIYNFNEIGDTVKINGQTYNYVGAIKVPGTVEFQAQTGRCIQHFRGHVHASVWVPSNKYTGKKQ
jgi:hypothetical protein